MRYQFSDTTFKLPFPFVRIEVTHSVFPKRIMHTNKQIGSIHPLMAGAAVSVMLVSLVGTAAITGSHGARFPSMVAEQAAMISAIAPSRRW